MGLIAYIEDAPWYAIALVAIATPGFVLWSLGQGKLFWGMHRQTIERSESIIRGWLHETAADVRNDPSPETTYWRMRVSQAGTHPVSVYRARQGPQVITMGINLAIAPADEAKLDELSGSDNSVLTSDLIIELARLGIEYAGLRHPIRRVLLTHRMAFDHNTTHLALTDALLVIVRAQVLVTQTIEREAKRRGVEITPPSTADMEGSQSPVIS